MIMLHILCIVVTYILLLDNILLLFLLDKRLFLLKMSFFKKRFMLIKTKQTRQRNSFNTHVFLHHSFLAVHLMKFTLTVREKQYLHRYQSTELGGEVE